MTILSLHEVHGKLTRAFDCSLSVLSCSPVTNKMLRGTLFSSGTLRIDLYRTVPVDNVTVKTNCRFLALSDREKRALAAERRLRETQEVCHVLYLISFCISQHFSQSVDIVLAHIPKVTSVKVDH